MKPFRSSIASLLALAAAGAFGQTTHAENSSFTADVTSFHTSVGGNGLHYVTATIHLRNATKAPLILAIDARKVKASDDQGNPYAGAMVRGVGTITGGGVDTKFVLPPGGGGDLLVEAVTRLDERTIRGVAFDLSVPLSEVTLLPSKQVRLGVERTAEFTGLKTGLAPAAGKIDAGPFTAEVLRKRVLMSADRRVKTVEMTVRLTNTSDKPLTLAYEYHSSYGIDDQGNRFTWTASRSGDGSATGIGQVSSSSADPQFVLAPGESREIQLSTGRRVGQQNEGTSYLAYFAFQALETLPSGQIREVRQYSLTFPGL